MLGEKLSAERAEQWGLAPLDDLFAQLDVARAILLATSKAFDFAPEPLPAPFVHVGPYLADPAWAEIADGMEIPMRGKAVISHDDYRVDEEKGATPDPLMGLFPFSYRLEPDQAKATLELYLGAAEAYVGSPMLSALYGVWAAWLGDRDLALKLLDDGYGQFCVGRFLQTLEYRPDRFPEQPQAGPFFANIGGFLTGLILGFTGLRVGPGGPETWAERTVVLPTGWTSIEIDRLWIKGRPMRLIARHGEMTELQPL